MRVIEMRGSGGPEVLQPAERPSPALSRGEVRVRVAASGVNRADLLQRRGRYPVPSGFPVDIPGMEFSGTIIEVGDGCHRRTVGDGVMGILGGGGYSEEVVLPEDETIRIPVGVSPVEAGAIPEVFVTAWDALVLQAKLEPGETVLIHAVGSGVGTAALQLCRTMGCRTIGTSRSPWKLQRAEELGLDVGVLLGDRDEDEMNGEWTTRIDERIDVLLDLLGGAYFEGNLQRLGEGGRWVVVGLTSGASATIDLRAFISKRATLIGTVLRSRSSEEKRALAGKFEGAVVPLFDTGSLRPIVDRTFPAENAAEAHRYVEENANFGKVLLIWDSNSGHPPASEGSR